MCIRSWMQEPFSGAVHMTSSPCHPCPRTNASSAGVLIIHFVLRMHFSSARCRRVYTEQAFSGHLLLGQTFRPCRTVPLPLPVFNLSMNEIVKTGSNTIPSLSLYGDTHQYISTPVSKDCRKHLKKKKVCGHSNSGE